jgi:hypothetical protein
MASQDDRPPHFNQPFANDSDNSAEAKDAGEWEKASTVAGDHDANIPAQQRIGSDTKPHKEESSEPETFDKKEITEEDCADELGFAYPKWKKWTILTVIFWIQVSMNFNTSLYSNGLGGISKEFNISEQAARCGAMIFLILYAFGCELWAPWSEYVDTLN